MKKKVIIGVSILLGLVLLAIVGAIVYYNVSLTPVGGNKTVIFNINEGMSASSVIKKLKSEGLIKDELIAKYQHSSCNCMFQAGEYELNTDMSMKEILEKLYSGNVINKNIKVTFKEGKRITDYVDVIANNFNYSKEDIFKVISDKDYLNELVNNYWFITNSILNDNLYYALEGYLYPDTYEFDPNSSIKEIINKLIKTMQNNLENFKEKIESSSYNVHQILTLASIIELEAAEENDRLDVGGVFYNRLNNGWTLGSDVTTYYASKKTFQDVLTYQDLQDCNYYNTRSNCVTSLPIGPISSPSLSSIKAAIEPNTNDYFFFVSDARKKVYFSKTAQEQSQVIQSLKAANLWLE
ncbi:MAG: endolytic transglycosylase MltG [Bacilli bacterium]|nr:endolytic transglycosylase MltG [Bacilli bacterium]